MVREEFNVVETTDPTQSMDDAIERYGAIDAKEIPASDVTIQKATDMGKVQEGPCLTDE